MDQPPVVEFVEVDGIFIKQMLLRDAHTVVPQHAHQYDHVSMLAYGSVSVWRDGVYLGVFRAPYPILIKAHTMHTFMSITPGTIIYCIHNIERSGAVEIAKEHQLEV